MCCGEPQLAVESAESYDNSTALQYIESYARAFHYQADLLRGRSYRPKRPSRLVLIHAAAASELIRRSCVMKPLSHCSSFVIRHSNQFTEITSKANLRNSSRSKPTSASSKQIKLRQPELSLTYHLGGILCAQCLLLVAVKCTRATSVADARCVVTRSTKSRVAPAREAVWTVSSLSVGGEKKQLHVDNLHLLLHSRCHKHTSMHVD